MMLSQLLDGFESESVMTADVKLLNLSLNSRNVISGTLFFALATHDDQRMSHLKQAIELGAIAIAYDGKQQLTIDESELLQDSGLTVCRIADLMSHVGEIAAKFYDYPSTKMSVIAVTGTNGKTSVSQFIAQGFEFLNIPCGVIGTLGVGRITELNETGMTTPDAVSMQAMLANFASQSIDKVVLEASSHALEQGRLNGVDVDIAVLTNLSRDHLDYHQTMENYAKAKQRLFEFSSLKHVVINVADTFGKTLVTDLKKRPVTVRTYSSEEANLISGAGFHVQASAITTNMSGISFKLAGDVKSTTITTKLLGRFNVDNLMAALLVLLSDDIEFEQAIDAITHCHSVEGRMELLGNKDQVQVVIDFAHTPDALTQVLTTLKMHLAPQGELWCVFGCGGDRDKGKRPLMGQTAEKNADKLVLTSDNPRSEQNENIVKDILEGINVHQNVTVEHDREQAILHAIALASKNDIVLIAGKGHEQYQEVLGVKKAFSDVATVIKALSAANDADQLAIKVSS